MQVSEAMFKCGVALHQTKEEPWAPLKFLISIWIPRRWGKTPPRWRIKHMDRVKVWLQNSRMTHWWIDSQVVLTSGAECTSRSPKIRKITAMETPNRWVPRTSSTINSTCSFKMKTMTYISKERWTATKMMMKQIFHRSKTWVNSMTLTTLVISISMIWSKTFMMMSLKNHSETKMVLMITAPKRKKWLEISMTTSKNRCSSPIPTQESKTNTLGDDLIVPDCEQLLDVFRFERRAS